MRSHFISVLPISLAILVAELPANAQTGPGTAATTSGKNDMMEVLKIVKQRVRTATLPRQPADQHALGEKARAILSTIKTDGSWADIEYGALNRSTWQTVDHMQRTLVLAKAFATPGQPLYENPELRDKTILALQWWLQNDYQNPNWWWNMIGVPQLVGETMLLMESHVTPEQRAKVLEILMRSEWTPGQGQNTVWLAGCSLIRGLLEDDAAVVGRCFNAIWDEIRIAYAPHEGIQPDFSFHQHKQQLYNGGYGLGFGNDVARYVTFAWGTPFQPDAQKVNLFSRYLLDGQQWMIRGRMMDYSTIGREITRNGKVGVPGTWTAGPISPAGAGYGLLNAVDLMADLPTARQAEFRAFAARLRRTPGVPALSGNRHFWRSDYTTHHRPGFFVSVKMLSSRMMNAEVVNNEGRKSFHLSDGATFLYRDGEEYYDIFAVWDWNRVPGTTVEVRDPMLPPNLVQIRGRSGFVGGVSDGYYGMTAMILDRDALLARKACFFFDEGYVLLGAGITDTSEHSVLTSVEQSWLRGSIEIQGQNDPLPLGRHALDGVRWVIHDGTGFVFAPGQAVTVQNTEQSGRWSDIGSGSDTLRTGDVFSVWIDHGVRPDGAEYAYTVLPTSTRESVEAFVRQNPWHVLANTSRVQAVWNSRSRVFQAAFYEPGTVSEGEGWSVTVDRACLVQVRDHAGGIVSVSVSQPENKHSVVHVSLDRRLSGDGASVSGDTTRLVFDLPDGDAAGSSVVKRFRSVTDGRNAVAGPGTSNR